MTKSKMRFAVAALVILGLLCGLCGCGDSTRDYRDKYVEIRDGKGNAYTLDYYNYGLKVEYDYSPSAVYSFTYQAYYSDGKTAPESGVANVRGDEIGEHPLEIELDLGIKGLTTVCFCAEIVKGYDKIHPEVRFFPNGAEVEGEGENVRYVYDFSAWQNRFPIVEVYYEDEVFKLKRNGENFVAKIYEVGGDMLDAPIDKPGFYYVNYQVPESYFTPKNRKRFEMGYGNILLELRA